MTSKLAAIVVMLALGGAAAVSSTSCSVHRKSDELHTCTTSVDCLGVTGASICDRGYCVASAGCPGACTSCPDDHTCRIECSAEKPCTGNIKCPAGLDCVIRCSDTSCSDIDCAGARSCDIRCTGSAVCGPVNCGSEACDIACTSGAVCTSIDCAASCGCRVACSGSAVCPNMSCPMTPAGDLCTQQGSAGANCDTGPPGCDTCPDF